MEVRSRANVTKEEILQSLIEYDPSRLGWWIHRGWEESGKDGCDAALLIKLDPVDGGISKEDREWIAEQLISAASDEIRHALHLDQ